MRFCVEKRSEKISLSLFRGIPMDRSLCSSGKFNPKRRAPHFLFFKSFYVTEIEKSLKSRKNPMREQKVTNRLVCDAMLTMAKIPSLDFYETSDSFLSQ